MARTGGGWQRSLALIAAAAPLLNACASPPAAFEPAASRPAAQPGIGTYRVGEPYEVHGVWYYPAVDYNYDRVGVASWYGEAFQGRLTANGEIFDLNGLTAAHTTLPMPSIVQVTDLENGRSLQLRVNDRGPFVDGRMIDVSRRAAQLLGFEQKGTAVVRVTVLKEESIAAAEDAMRNRGQVMVAQASNTATAPPPAPSYEPATGPSSRLAALPAPKPAPPTVAMAGPARGSVAPSPPAAGTAAPRPAPAAVAAAIAVFADRPRRSGRTAARFRGAAQESGSKHRYWRQRTPGGRPAHGLAFEARLCSGRSLCQSQQCPAGRGPDCAPGLGARRGGGDQRGCRIPRPAGPGRQP